MTDLSRRSRKYIYDNQFRVKQIYYCVQSSSYTRTSWMMYTIQNRLNAPRQRLRRRLSRQPLHHRDISGCKHHSTTWKQRTKEAVRTTAHGTHCDGDFFYGESEHSCVDCGRICCGLGIRSNRKICGASKSSGARAVVKSGTRGCGEGHPSYKGWGLFKM